MLESSRTLTAWEYSFQDEQEGTMEPKNPLFHDGKCGSINSTDISHRGIIGLLYRKKERMNLNGTHLPTVRRMPYTLVC